IIYREWPAAITQSSEQMTATFSEPSTMAMVNPSEDARPAASLPAAVQPKSPVAAADKAVKDNKPADKDESEIDSDNDERADQDTLLRKFQNGKRVKMNATAYCINNTTASGVKSKYGIVAADPELLPIGSIVHIEAGEYSGFYTVLDTGALIKGRKIDIYLSDYKEACNFGRRKVRLKVLRYGWNPQASAPAF